MMLRLLVVLFFLLGVMGVVNLLDLSLVSAQIKETEIGSFSRSCIGTCGCMFTIKECDINYCDERGVVAPNCNVAPSGCNALCGNGEGGNDYTGIAEGALQTILEWDGEIVASLERGSDTDFNKLPQPISNGNYSTGTRSGAGEDFWYWCTHSIIDSYRLAGFTGLQKFNETRDEDTHHEAVVNMRKFWRDQSPKDTYVYVDYPITGGSPKELAAALKKVKPGYAMFMEEYPGEMKKQEHVGMVTKVYLDKRNNGYIDTRDSNTSKKDWNYTIVDGKIMDTKYPVRGFGGVLENAQSADMNKSEGLFANLPGKHAVAAILPSGEIVEVNGTTPMPALSTIKLWVAAAVFEAIGRGELSLSDTYTLTDNDKQYYGTYLNTASKNTFSIEDYLNYTLSYSDNMATNVLINKVGGISAVNDYIKRNGYQQTKLQRYLGTTGYTAANDNYSSGIDGATFMKNLFAGQVVSTQASEQLLALLRSRSSLKKDQFYIKEKGFVGKSGFDGTKTRNDVGSFEAGSGRVFMGIFLTGLPNEQAGEKAIQDAASEVANLAK